MRGLCGARSIAVSGVDYELGERKLSVRASDLEAFIAKCRVGSGDAAGDVAGSNEDLRKSA
jgi:hypothetical protein